MCGFGGGNPSKSSVCNLSPENTTGASGFVRFYPNLQKCNVQEHLMASQGWKCECLKRTNGLPRRQIPQRTKDLMGLELKARTRVFWIQVMDIPRQDSTKSEPGQFQAFSPKLTLPAFLCQGCSSWYKAESPTTIQELKLLMPILNHIQRLGLTADIFRSVPNCSLRDEIKKIIDSSTWSPLHAGPICQ